MLKPNWEKRKKRVLLTENALVLVTIYLMENGNLGYDGNFSKQDVVNEAGRLFGLSNKTTLKAIKILEKYGLVQVIGKNPSRVKLTKIGKEVGKYLLSVEEKIPSFIRYPNLRNKFTKV